MLEQVDQIILLAMPLLPATGALFVFALPPSRPDHRSGGQIARFNALMFTMGTLVLAGIAVARLASGAQLGSSSDWLRVAMGLDFAWGFDPISAVAVLMVALIAPAAVLSSTRQLAMPARGHFAWILLAEACLLGALVSRDLLFLSMFVDGAVVSVFLSLGQRRNVEGDRSFRWLTVQMLASGLWLVGVLHLGWIHYTRTGLMSFAFVDLLYLRLGWAQALVTGVLLGASAATRAGVWPVRVGLRHVLHGAPAGAAVLLVGGILKLGVYLAIAVVIPALLPHSLEASLTLSIVFGAVALLSAVMCYRQRTVLDLLGWSASLMGALALLGAATSTAMGISGAMLLMGAHAVSFAGLLLVLVSAVPGATTAHLADTTGLGRRRPALAVLAAIWFLSMVAVPGLGAFAGASMILGAKMPQLRTGDPLWIALGATAAFATALHTAQMVMLSVRLLIGNRKTHAARRPHTASTAPQHAFRVLGMTTVLLTAMLIVALGADLFEPALASDASRSLSTAYQRDTFPGITRALSVARPWSRLLSQAVVLLSVAVAVTALRSVRVWGLLGCLGILELAAAALAALAGSRAPSYSYLTDGLRVSTSSVIISILHAAGVLLVMSGLKRTRREPTDSLADLAGAGSSHPGTVLAMGLLLWSIAGLTPTVGGMRRFMVTGTIVTAGWPGVAVGWSLARALGMVACVRLLSSMLRPAPSGELFAPREMTPWSEQIWRATLTAVVSAVLVLGILPEVLLEPLGLLLR